MNIINNLKRRLKPFFDKIRFLRLLQEQNEFLLYEIQRLNEERRRNLLGQSHQTEQEVLQTRASFDYQWSDFESGANLLGDVQFRQNVTSQICEFTDLSPDWFPGKRIIDIGCGIGRYSYGLLSLGAVVKACDQSDAAIEKTQKNCQQFIDRLTTEKVDLLNWNDEADFDMAFCYGVVHHTGNTYVAMRNVLRKVKPGGRVFFMIYAFPKILDDFIETNSYNRLYEEMRPLSFKERKQLVIERFGAEKAHGWFDAASPAVKEVLTFNEIIGILTDYGFSNIKRTFNHRNHHLIADKTARIT